MKKLIILTFSILICIGCAPTQFLKPEYTGKDYSENQLLIYPVHSKQITVMNYDDF